MKTLIVMRHAKSAYPSGVLDDFHRPLNKRGRADASRMAKVLKVCGPRPDRVVSSSAARAAETARAVCEVLGLSGEPLTLDDRLYQAAPAVLSQVASETTDAATTQLVLAHNPGMEEWVGELCGANARLPTAALAVVILPASRWTEIGSFRGQLQWLLVPRLLKKML